MRFDSSSDPKKDIEINKREHCYENEEASESEELCICCVVLTVTITITIVCLFGLM